MLLLTDSFDHYAIADITQTWTQVEANAGSNTIQSGLGRHSSNCLQTTCSGLNDNRATSRFRVVPSSPAPTGDTIIVGAGFQSVSAFSQLHGSTLDSVIFNILQGSASQGYLRLNTNGTIGYYRGDNVQIGSTSAVALSAGVFAHIEMKVKISDTVGTVDVRINGASVITATAVDTKATASATWDEIALGYFRTTGTSVVTVRYDDFYLADGSGSYNTDLLGDCRIDYLTTNGAGTYAEGTPSAGSNYQTVDEKPANGDTDYNTMATVGLRDSFAFEPMPVSAAVMAVRVICQAKKTTEGSGELQMTTRISGADYAGTSKNVPSSYSMVGHIFERNPADNSAWTEAVIAAAEFGYKKSA